MIDINLLGKKKAKPEKAPGTRKQSIRKLIIYLIFAAVVVYAFYKYSDSLLSLVYKTPPTPMPFSVIDTTRKPVTTPPPDTQKVVTQPRVLGAEQPAKPPRISGTAPSSEYSKSIEQISAFTTFVNTVKDTIDITLLSVSDGHITAEIIIGNKQINEIKNSIAKSLLNYQFDFIPRTRDGILQIFGTVKADSLRVLGAASPSGEYTSADAIITAINTIAKNHTVKIPVRSKTKAISREGISVLPVYIKLSGTEKNLLNFLQEIQTKGLPLTITKISGKSVNRSQSTTATVLYFEFEIKQ